jgi:uncharacterized protein YvpB
MQLDVLALLQQHPEGCGPAAMSMLLHYLDDPVSEEDILAQIGGIRIIDGQGNRGTLVIDNALYARSRGYAVTCLSYNTKLLPRELEGIVGSELQQRISLISSESPVDQEILCAYGELLSQGVEFRFTPPRLNQITSLLKRKIPSIVNVNTRLFYGNEELAPEIGHSIVATGFDKTNIYCNDPGIGSIMVERKHLLGAIERYAASRSAYLIAIEPYRPV